MCQVLASQEEEEEEADDKTGSLLPLAATLTSIVTPPGSPIPPARHKRTHRNVHIPMRRGRGWTDVG